MKRYVAIGAVALLLAGAVYWSYSLNIAAETVGDASGVSAALPEDTAEMPASSAGEVASYFEQFRAERESARALEIEYLDEIIETSASDSETLEDAQSQKLTLVEHIEAEFTIESLIKAKGFADAAVTFHKGAVNVIVENAELNGEQVAQILDIVQRETGEKAENIKIMATGNG